jgi:hypothetical protein
MRVTHLSLALVALTALFLGCQTELDIDAYDHYEPEDDGNIDEQGVYNCTERDDTGFRSGSRFSIKVVTVDGKPVERDTANAYIAMQEAAARAGVNIRIVSGFRTNAEQQRLYNCYTQCNCNNCNLAARPGYSNHQSGHALDLNTSESGVLNWLNNNGRRFGFSRTVPSEQWHWEWWGNGSDFNGPCGGAPRPSENVAPDDCTSLPSAGGVIDEDDSCMTLGGPTQYLRSVEDSNAHDGDLVWTGATANGSAANFGTWWVKVPAPGRYKLEVFVNRTYGTSRQAKYSLRHNGRTDVVTLNYETAGGFRSLGEFEFSGAAGERVRLDDNTGEASSLGRKLVFDGLRVTPVAVNTTPPPPPSQSCSSVRVSTGGSALNVRPTASTAQAARGTVNDGQVVERLSTERNGQEVRGTTTWYEIRSGSLRGYISGAYASCVQ